MINGSLFEVAEETIRFIISHLKVAFEITGDSMQRNEIFEYPIPAIRELVLNALIHRDYTSPSDVQIKIYDQKISFFNPGNLYGGLTIEALTTDSYSSQTRNKLIAEAFYLTRDIEKYGSGFIRVRKEISTYATMTFRFHEQGNGFLTELSYSKQKTDSTTPQTTPQTILNKPLKGIKLDIIEILIKHPDASREYLAIQTNRSANTIKDHLKWLILNNYLKRVGPDYGGHWEVIQNYKDADKF